MYRRARFITTSLFSFQRSNKLDKADKDYHHALGLSSPLLVLLRKSFLLYALLMLVNNFSRVFRKILLYCDSVVSFFSCPEQKFVFIQIFISNYRVKGVDSHIIDIAAPLLNKPSGSTF